MYAIGGEVILNGNKTLASIEKLDRGSWVFQDDMPAALHGVPAVSHQGFIYILGGSEMVAGIVNNGRVFRSRQY